MAGYQNHPILKPENSKEQQTEYNRNHRRLFLYGLQMKSVWIGLGFLSLLTSGVIILMMYGLSTAVDAVFMQEKSLVAISSVLWILAGAMIIRGILFWFSEVLAQRAASGLKEKLRNDLSEHIRKLGPVWVNRQQSGELASSAVEGVEKLDEYYARFMPAAIHMMIVPIILALFVFYIDWLSGLILIVTGPLIPVFMTLIGMKAQSQTQQQWATLTRLSSHFLDVVQGLRTLMVFNQADTKHREIETISDRFRSTTMGVLKIAFLSGLVLELFASIATALVAVEIGIRLVEGHIGFQLGLFVLLLAPEYYLPFRMFGARHHAGMEGTEAAGRLFEILDTRVPDKKEEPTISVPNAPYAIRFDNVAARYGDSSQTVLQNCNLEIKPGKTTALVGRSGAGKTTIVRLLTRELAPSEGHIVLNGVPMDLLDERQWLNQVAVVNQKVWLFDDTILGNLRIARPDAPFEEVVAAAKNAEAHDFITQLPEGYNTHTGEGAARLSGGERQRLSIARAFLKDAPIIILDEPSSALDPESEYKISSALQRLFKDRSVLVIAHRLSTVRNADHILVLEHGHITQEGTHQTLSQTDGLYRQMIRANRGVAI